MDRNLVLLNRNIARLRRDVRLQSSKIEQLIAADLDCTCAAQRLIRAQADLVSGNISEVAHLLLQHLDAIGRFTN
jgi:hypothetical protein